MEIVSEPEIASPEEARHYFQKLRQILVWIGVNTGDMEKGALRCDANVSVRPVGQQEYGTKVEIKNVNSFRALERAVTYEIARQIVECEAGRPIPQSTRGWNDEKGETILQRIKEGSADYRYFPEPDIPPLRTTSEFVASHHLTLPELPHARRARFMAEYGLSANDADVLTDIRSDSEYFEAAVATARAHGVAPREVAVWVTGELFRLMKDSGEALDAVAKRFPPAYIAEVQQLLVNGTITRTSAKEVFETAFREGRTPSAIVAERGLAVIGAGDALREVVRAAIDANPKVVADYRAGKIAAIKFLVGQVMKATKGQASPQAAQEALEQELG
jgi:aspartyl-tRNA(Asn)/glutamyl-tRNA(Gln) amidotransferase subunit B